MMFLVFAGYSYYPEGGWSDYIGCNSNYEDALYLLKIRRYDWAQVVDSQTLKVVETFNCKQLKKLIYEGDYE